MRPVDPGIAIESQTITPQPSDLGVAPFVRGERRVAERHPRHEREEHTAADTQRWGPPREGIDARTLKLGAATFVIALGAAMAVFGLSLTPDRFLLVLLPTALVMRVGRRYVLDFVPFAALIVFYAALRGWAHVLHPVPYYLPQLNAEKFFFFGHVPAVDLQQWFWSGHERVHDTVILFVTRIHSIVPTTFAFLLWLKRRALFYRFATTILTLSFASALTFYLFPAAPPWAAAQAGLLDVVKIGGTHAATSSVPTSASGSSSVYALIHGNPYAAIPSLHGGYAFLVFLFVATLAWGTRRRWLAAVAALYPLAQIFAVIYTGNHYVVDIVIGCAYAAAALFGVRYMWRRLGLPE